MTQHTTHADPQRRRRSSDCSIIRRLILRAGVPMPMRMIVLYLLAACRNKPFTYATVETIRREVRIGKDVYYRLVKKLENLGVIYRLPVKWSRTIGNLTFVNRDHPLLRRWKGKLSRQRFYIDEDDVIEGVAALLAYRRKGPQGHECPDEDKGAEIIARCLKMLQKRGVLRVRQPQANQGDKKAPAVPDKAGQRPHQQPPNPHKEYQHG